MKPLHDELSLTGDLQEQVLDAFRLELAEYGALLCLFDDQQNAVLNRNADAVLELSERIDAQLHLTSARRRQREALVSSLAMIHERPIRPSLAELMLLFREPLRPLVQALASEINHLITRTRKRAQQNQMLLARTIEVTQEVLERLNPGAVTRTYSPRGRMKMRAATSGSRIFERS